MPEVRKRVKRAKEGDFVKIPLDDHYWAYGRVADGTVVAYDIRTDKPLTPSEIVGYPVIFRVSVMRYAFNGKEWPVIGNLPLEEQWLKPPQFLHVQTDEDRHRYYGTTNGSDRFPISYEQAKELELLAVYDLEHVKERLRLHFQGESDPEVEMFRVK